MEVISNVGTPVSLYLIRGKSMKRIIPILVILEIVILWGCSFNTSPTVEATTPPIEKLTQSPITLTSTEIPSSTSRPPTPDTPTQILVTQTSVGETPTPSLEELHFQCLEVMDKLPPGAVYHGRAVLKGWLPDPGVLMDLATGELITLPKDIYDVVSPDRTHLAYMDWSDESGNFTLVVTDPNEQDKIVIPWEKDWFSLVQWLDNQRLVIIKESYPLYSTVILNPFTKKQQEIPSNYPDILTTFQYHYWGDYAYSEAVYDPTLTRVVYMLESRERDGFILRDLQDGITLGSYQISADDYGQTPKWSPNGERFAIVISEFNPTMQVAQELYTISREGQESRLTYLSNHNSYSRINEYSWSPDGRYIAFWWTNDPDYKDGEQLAILDTQTGEVINYCVPGALHGQAVEPVWSPDGKQVLTEYIPRQNERRFTILVDFTQGFAVKLAEGRTPVGWMVEP